jgi:short-subunit dehydrogenase
MCDCDSLQRQEGWGNRAECADMTNRSFALVTGASQGLGRVFAHALAARKQNVILVARSRDKLESLADELQRSQSVFPEVLDFDLACPSAGQRLAQQLRDRKLQVNLLVNNAGFGVRGEFLNLTLRRQMEMLSLNNAAVVELTYSLLPSLMEHPQAGIINVSSAAGFQPVPYASLYAATKSFLTSFSLGLQEELRSSRVSVVTLCPGRILAPGHSGEAKNGHRKFSFIYQSPEDVVRDALESLANGGGLVIPGFVNKLSVFAQRLIPRRAVPTLVARMSRQ